jgi:hypothetical protein
MNTHLSFTRIRLLILAVSLMLMIYAVWPAPAEARSPYVCCDTTSDCESFGQVCCSPESIGVPACDNYAGICAFKCVIVNGG